MRDAGLIVDYNFETEFRKGSNSISASNHSCTNVYCRGQLVCKDIDGQPRCVSRTCRRSCPVMSLPVCGSDGKTYTNECQLRRIECMKNSGVTKDRNGPCKTKAKGILFKAVFFLISN